MERFINQEYQREIEQKIITTEDLRRIYDELSLMDIFNQLENIDASVLTDPLIINHEFYSLIINKLQNLLILWSEEDHLTECDSDLFHPIIRVLCKMQLSPDQLIQPIEKCLTEISTNGKLLNNNDHIIDFSNLIGCYTQNEQIMEAIIKCLCSKYYTESIGNENHPLLTFPTYWIAYKGPHREEFADQLLTSLLVSSADLLRKRQTEQGHKSLTQFIDLLSHNLSLCGMTIFENHTWIEIINVLLLILNEELLSKKRKSMIKSICHLVLILINNNQKINQYVKDFQERFEILIETENEALLILTSFINDSEMQTLLAKNPNFAQFLDEYLQENDHNENIRIHSFIQRLKKILIQRLAPTALPFQPMIKSNENKNQEDITLIWFDKNNDATEKTVLLLQQINDYVFICSDRETCIEHIEQIKTEKLFLILSGSNAEEILEQIHDRKQIDSIFIFCFKPEKYQRYLNNDQFYKVVGIYTEYEPLLKSIEENIRVLIKQSEAAGLFDQDERSMRNLNRESYSFNYFLAFKQILLKTTYNNDLAKHEMIEICRDYYRNNKKELSNIDDFDRTYQSKDAIYWYTRQSFIYRLVNKALRTEDYQAMLVLRFFILDLCENLRQLKQEHSQTIVSYRGLKLLPAEIYNLKHNIDATIATNGFLSTSRSKKVAYKFAKKGSKRLNLETVMLEIHVDLSKVTTNLVDIAQFSDYPEEEEILFDLGASFTINSVDYDVTQKMWFVKLEAQSEESTINVLKEYRLEDDMNILLGKLLFKTEKYDLCRHYFENLFNFYGNEQHEALAKIYDYMGRSFSRLKDDDKAIANYARALEYYTALNRLENVATLTNWIGLQYHLKGDKETARIYHEKSHEIWKQLPIYTSEKPHCEIGRLMICFGHLEENNQIICDYFLKALQIYQNPSETCEHIDHDFWIGLMYENLADKYYDGNDYEKAFEYIMKCVHIRRKDLSTATMRKDYYFCLNSLLKICQKIHQDVWSPYQNEFFQLIDTDLLREYPHLKDLFDSVNASRRLDFSTENIDYNALTEFLDHSIKSLKYFLKNDPKNYERIIQAHTDIGLAYSKAKHYHWSIEHLQTALQMCQTYLPSHSTHLSTIYTQLSDTCLDRNDFDQAFIHRMKALSIHPETSQLTEKEREAQCYYDMAFKLPDISVDKRLEFFMKSLEIRQDILPEDNINIAYCHAHIADAYKLKSVYNVAIEHYKNAIRIYEKNLSDSTVKKVHDVCYSQMITIYCLQKNYDDALDSKMKVLNSDEKYSHLTEQEKEAQCFYDIGLKLFEQDPDKALEYFQRSLQIRQEILPTDDVNIAFCHDDIGWAYEKKSMSDIALEHYQKAIQIYEKHLFDEQEYQFNVRKLYIQCQSVLAKIYCKQQKYSQALECKMKAVNIHDKYSHLTEQEKQAQAYFDLGNALNAIDIDKGLEFLLKSLELRQDILPEDHVTIGFSCHYIGVTYEDKSMFDIAIDYYSKAIKIYKKHLFDKNEYQFNVKKCYILCHWSLVELCSKQGNYDQAFESKTKMLNIDEKYSDLTREEKEAQCYYDIGSDLTEQDPDKALEFYQKSLRIREEILPEDHTKIGFCHHGIGVAYVNKSMPNRALEHYEKAMKIYEKHLFDKVEHQFNIKTSYIKCLSNLVALYCQQQKYDEAFDLKMKVLNTDEKYSHLTEQEKEAQCYFDIGEKLLEREVDKALEYSQKSLEIRQEILPDDHVTIGFSHQDIGAAYDKKSMVDMALKHFMKAIEIYEHHLSDKQEYQCNVKELYIACHSNLVKFFCQNGKLDDAVTSKMKMLKIDEKYSHLTEQEREAQCYYDIGSNLLDRDLYSALEYRRKLLRIQEEILPEDHTKIGFCHHDIGVIYDKKSMFDIAAEHYHKAIEIYEKHLFDREEYELNVKTAYINCLSNLVGIYCQQQKYDQAFDLKMKVLNIDEKYSHLTEQEKEAQCYSDIGSNLLERDPDKALEFYQKSLRLREEILPEDHANNGVCHHEIGVIYYRKSMFDIAFEHYQKAIVIYEKHLFDQEEYQFNVKNGYSLCLSALARHYCQEQKYDQGCDSKMKAVNMDEKYSRLTEKEREAQCYFDMGHELICREADKAFEFYQKSLQIREEILPKDDVTIGFSHEHIGATCEKKSMSDIALKHYQKAIEIYEKHLLDKEEYQFNIKTVYIRCLLSLVRIYSQQEQYDQAFDFKMKALNMDEKYSRLTEKEKDAQCYFDIGNQLLIKQADKRLEFIFKSLELRQQIVPPDHITIAFCYQYIGVAYEDKYKFAISIEYYTKATEIYEKHLHDHEEYQFNVIEVYGRCYTSISRCYSFLEKVEYVNAVSYALKAIEIYQKYSPKNKDNLALSYLSYSYILLKQGQYDEAIAQTQKSLDTLLYESNIYVALSYHFLGDCLDRKFENEQALQFYEKALTNYKRYFINLNDKNIGYISYDLALCLHKLNKSDQALKYAIRSIQIREEILSLIHIERAESHSLLALIYSKLSQNDLCHKHRIKALQISKQLLLNDECTESLDEIYENIGELYRNENNLRKARKYYKKALHCVMKDKVNGHPDIKRFEKILNELSEDLNSEISVCF